MYLEYSSQLRDCTSKLHYTSRVQPVQTCHLWHDATRDRSNCDRLNCKQGCEPYRCVILFVSKASPSSLCQKYTLHLIVKLNNPIKLSALPRLRLLDETLHGNIFFKANCSVWGICFDIPGMSSEASKSLCRPTLELGGTHWHRVLACLIFLVCLASSSWTHKRLMLQLSRNST